MSNAMMQARAAGQLAPEDHEKYDKGGAAAVSNALLQQLLFAADEEDTPSEDGAGLTPEMELEVLHGIIGLQEARRHLRVDEEDALSMSLGLLDPYPGDMAGPYLLQAKESEHTIRSVENQADAGLRGAKAAFFHANDEQKPRVTELHLDAEEAMAEVGTLAPSYAEWMSIPGAEPTLRPGGVLSDEIARARPDTAEALVAVEGLFKFQVSPEGADAAAATYAGMTDGRGYGGNARYLARAMFEAALPLAFVEAFCRESGMSLADFPALAQAAMVREGAVMGDHEADLNIALEALGRDVSTIDTRTTGLPPLGDLEDLETYAGIARAYNQLVDFDEAIRRLKDETPEPDDLERMRTAPEAAQRDWDAARAQLPDLFVQEYFAGFGDAIAERRAVGRIETLSRQGFIVGETDDDAIFDTVVTVGREVLAFRQETDAEGRAKGLALAGLPAGGPSTSVLANFLSAVDGAQSLDEKLEAARKAGFSKGTGLDFAATVTGIGRALAGAANDTIGIRRAILEAELDEIDRWAASALGLDPDIPMAALDDMPTRSAVQVQQGIDALNRASTVLSGVGAISDVLSIVQGVRKIQAGDIDGGAFDIAGGVVGLAGFAGGVVATAPGASAATAAMGASVAEAAGPIGLLIGFGALVNESIDEAYEGFRRANAGGRAAEYEDVMETLLQARRNMKRADAAIQLMRGPKPPPAEEKVYAEAVDAVRASALAVDAACEAVFESDGPAEAAHYQSGWVGRRSELASAYQSKARGARDRLASPGRTFQEKVDLAKGPSARVFEGASALATSLNETASTGQ